VHIEDDELVQDLSASLTKAIGNLPDDGKDHELRIKIKGRGNSTHINLGNQTFEIRSEKESPPKNSDRARICPQCEKFTWRLNQLCMHCDYDLHRHDQTQADELAEQLRQKVNLRLMQVCLVAVAVAIGGFSLYKFLPEEFQKWVIGISVVAGLLAFFMLQGTENKPS